VSTENKPENRSTPSERSDSAESESSAHLLEVVRQITSSMRDTKDAPLDRRDRNELSFTDLASLRPDETRNGRLPQFLLIEPLFKNGPKGDSQSPARTEAKSPDGGVWKKDSEGNWSDFDAAGKPRNQFNGAKVADVIRADDGSLTINFQDKTSIKQKSDNTSLLYTADGKLDTVTYADGSTRQFKYEGDDLIATKVRDGKWFDRQKSAEGYSDMWQIRGQTGQWAGTIEVDKANGNYSYTAKAGEAAGTKVVARTDEATEQHLNDGSTRVTFPNKCTQTYDKEMRLTQMTSENGTARTFGWTKEGTEDKLSSITVKRPDGNEFRWQNKDGQWSVNGKKQNYEFSVDSKSGTYIWTDKDKGETTTVNSAGMESVAHKDGLTIESNHGKYVRSSNNEGSFDYKRDNKGGLLELTLTKNGEITQRWNWDGNKGWVNKDGNVAGSSLTFGDKGEPVFITNGRTTRVDHSGKSFSQFKNEKTGSTVESTDGSLNTQSKEGMQRQFQLATDGSSKGQPIQETRIAGGKTETWVREKNNESYTNSWKCVETGKTESRNHLNLTNKGELSYSTENGTSYSSTAEGNEKISNASKKFEVSYKNGLAEEIKYPDGHMRNFSYDANRAVTSIVVTKEGEATSQWTRIAEDKWKSKTGTEWNAHIEIKGDSYEITDLDDKSKKTIRTADGFKSEDRPAESKYFESLNGALIKATVDGNTRTFERDADGTVQTVIDSNSGHSYRKQDDGSWSTFDKDNKQIDDGYARIGNPSIADDGHISFLNKDGSIVKQELGKPPENIGGKSALDVKIVESDKLPIEAKIRFIENLAQFNSRTDINNRAKQDTIAQIERLMDSRSEKLYGVQDRWKLAEQLVWTCANIDKDCQGQHPTCSMTSIRNSLVRETPAKFAKMIADVCINGEFRTFDGSRIVPRSDSLAAGAEEKTFPPDSGSRTWIGQISDVTLANVFWQRQTIDPRGYHVQKGSLKYDEVRPTGKDDDGTRLFWYDQRADGLYRTHIPVFAGLNMPKIVDVYQQVTGTDQTARGLVHSSRNTGNAVPVVNTVEDLKTQLTKGPWPKIVQLQNNVLYGKNIDDADHEHVVVVTGYNPTTGKIAIDNSHSATEDLLTPDKQVTVDRLFAAMAAPTLAQRKINAEQARLQQLQQQQYYYQNGVLYRRY
jgi:hypothetical protein